MHLLLDEVGTGIGFLLAPVQGILPDTPEAGDTMLHILLHRLKLLLDATGTSVSLLLALTQTLLPHTFEIGNTILHVPLHRLKLLLDEIRAGVGILPALLQAAFPDAFETGHLMLCVLFQRLKLLTKATGPCISILPTLSQTILEISPDALQILPHLGVQVRDRLEDRPLVLLQGVLALIETRLQGEPHFLQTVLHILMHLVDGTKRVITIIF